MNRLVVFFAAFALFCSHGSWGVLGVPSVEKAAHRREDMTTLEQSKQLVLGKISLRAPACFNNIRNVPIRNGAYPSHLFFAADNTIEGVYINGVLAGPTNQLNDWHDFGTAYAYLKEGDVIAIEASDFGVWYGAVASLFWENQFFATGRDDFRAKLSDGSDPTWKQPGFDGCRWTIAQARPNAGSYNDGKSEYYPYYTGAKYVWAQGAGVNTKIRIRHVVGNTCK